MGQLAGDDLLLTKHSLEVCQLRVVRQLLGHIVVLIEERKGVVPEIRATA
jgi:hypothetical protein